MVLGRGSAAVHELEGTRQTDGLQLTGEGGLLQWPVRRLLEQPGRAKSPITSAGTGTIPAGEVSALVRNSAVASSRWVE